MKRKILIVVIGIIVLSIVLALIGIGHDYGREAIFKWLFSRTEAAKTKTPIEKLQRIDSLLALESTQWNLSVNGNVHGIEGRNVTIVGLTERGEETASLVVPVSQEAKIISDYILPEGAAKEEITGRISIAGGKEYNLGQKEIILEEIKVGDDVFISLNLKPDYTIEGIQIRVSPANLFYNLRK